jgi:hypothetical protein
MDKTVIKTTRQYLFSKGQKISAVKNPLDTTPLKPQRHMCHENSLNNLNPIFFNSNVYQLR